MTLIHTALLCEAQAIIERFKLTKIDKNLYKNEKIIVAVSSIGEEKTFTCINEIFSKYDIKKAVNIGIAGCSDRSINIGELFCTNASLKGIKTASITTVSKPLKNIDTLLVDMESSAFVSVCKKLHVKHFVLKVVSDYLDDEIPKKAFVTSLIRESLDRWIWLV